MLFSKFRELDNGCVLLLAGNPRIQKGTDKKQLTSGDYEETSEDIFEAMQEIIDEKPEKERPTEG